jgi:hypothetical protein
MTKRRIPALNKKTQVMRRFVEVAALIIAGLFVGAAGVEAQQEASPPSSVVRSMRPGGPDPCWRPRPRRYRAAIS